MACRYCEQPRAQVKLNSGTRPATLVSARVLLCLLALPLIRRSYGTAAWLAWAMICA